MLADVEEYLKSIESILARDESQQDVKLEDFTRARVQIAGGEKFVYIGGEEYAFDKIFLVNVVERSVQPMNSTNFFFVQISQHVFTHKNRNGKIFMLALDKSLGAAYEIIAKKYEKLKQSSLPRSYQPVAPQSLDFTVYQNFERALEVVSTHRDISMQEASSITSQWLEKLPAKFHEALIYPRSGTSVAL
jgi:hypothetical protein